MRWDGGGRVSACAWRGYGAVLEGQGRGRLVWRGCGGGADWRLGAVVTILDKNRRPSIPPFDFLVLQTRGCLVPWAELVAGSVEIEALIVVLLPVWRAGAPSMRSNGKFRLMQIAEIEMIGE